LVQNSYMGDIRNQITKNERVLKRKKKKGLRNKVEGKGIEERGLGLLVGFRGKKKRIVRIHKNRNGKIQRFARNQSGSTERECGVKGATRRARSGKRNVIKTRETQDSGVEVLGGGVFGGGFRSQKGRGS